MSTFSPPILLCTNGSDAGRPALDFGLELANLLQSPVTLFGVVETARLRPGLERLLVQTAERLEAAGVDYKVQVGSGRGSLVIARKAAENQYLTVVGPLGRPMWRRALQGRSFRRLLEKVATPLLYVPVYRWPLKRLLLCMGGLEYSQGVEHVMLNLARCTGAHLTLLHVVEPINLDYPVARQIQAHWQDILETDTPQARNLRQALAKSEAAGVAVDFKVRHGNAVHEIGEELRQGEYDLVGMGSPHSTQSLRHLYLPNVTAEVAEALYCPVLSVRKGYDFSS